MIYQLKLGSPMETEAVADRSEIEERDQMEFIELLGNLGGELRVNKDAGEDEPELELTYRMSEDTAVYGLGESNRGINKRGYLFVSENSDDPDHTEDKHSLYGSHNFLIIRDAEEEFGLFFDYPSTVTFDLGYEHRSLIRITAPTRDMYIYLITGSDMRSIVRQFRGMIGTSYIAPMWAFGFGQSRWGYKTASDIREVVNGYRAAGIPLDMVYLDIDYMQDYKDFTVNEERFPDFGDFVEEMSEQGIHLVPIIDAGVKVEKDYDVYEEGKAGGYFCTNEDSSLFSVGVWPGWTHFPDFFKPETRVWFGDLYKRLTDYGIRGFWNDMNEPAIFYTEQNIAELWDKLREASEKGEEGLNVEDMFALTDMFNSLSSHEQYKNFYHTIGGKKVRHDKVHNLYGCYMTQSAAEGLKRALPDERTLLFSRSSYIGMHRGAGIWMGDNRSWWSHILLNLQMLPGLNMCGFLYTGADTGGFGSDTTEDLLIRWIELSIFTPLFRNHSAIGTRLQECYRFDNPEIFKELISLRYRLIPYLYSEYLKAAQDNDMLFRPLCFDFEDDREAAAVDDQLMLGESLMIAPVYRQNATGRMVYLPEEMLMVKFTSASEYTTEVMPQGYHYVKMALTEVVVFVRHGHMLPLGVAEVCTSDLRKYNDLGSRGELKGEDFELISFEDEHPIYDMYTDSHLKTFVSRLIKE